MALGDLSKIDSLEFDTSRGVRASAILHIAGDIYAVSYSGSGSDGWLKTFAMDSVGNIGSVISSLEFAPATTVVESEIRHVVGDIYAIAYADTANDEGRIVTVEIDSAGNITDPVVDGPVAFSAAILGELDFIKVADGMFACLYSTDGWDAFICTIGIASDGAIDAAISDFLEFDTEKGRNFNIIHIAGDFFAIVYDGRGTLPDPFGSIMLVTVEISSAGAIPAAVTDSLEVTQYGTVTYPEILHVFGDTYIIALQEVATFDGLLKTISIDSGGGIGAVIDTQKYDEFEASFYNRPSLVHVAGNLFAIAYRRVGNFGRIVTLTVDNAGNIAVPVLDTLSFGTGFIHHAHRSRLTVIKADVLDVADYVLAVAYYDYYSDGRLGTIGVVPSKWAGLNPALMEALGY